MFTCFHVLLYTTSLFTFITAITKKLHNTLTYFLNIFHNLIKPADYVRDNALRGVHYQK